MSDKIVQCIVFVLFFVRIFQLQDKFSNVAPEINGKLEEVNCWMILNTIKKQLV